MSKRVDTASKLIHASASSIYDAFSTADAMCAWLPPRLVPDIELANDHRLSHGQVKEIERIIEVHYDELKSAWHKHFPG